MQKILKAQKLTKHEGVTTATSLWKQKFKATIYVGYTCTTIFIAYCTFSFGNMPKIAAVKLYTLLDLGLLSMAFFDKYP